MFILHKSMLSIFYWATFHFHFLSCHVISFLNKYLLLHNKQPTPTTTPPPGSSSTSPGKGPSILTSIRRASPLLAGRVKAQSYPEASGKHEDKSSSPIRRASWVGLWDWAAWKVGAAAEFLVVDWHCHKSEAQIWCWKSILKTSPVVCLRSLPGKSTSFPSHIVSFDGFIIIFIHHSWAPKRSQPFLLKTSSWLTAQGFRVHGTLFFDNGLRDELHGGSFLHILDKFSSRLINWKSGSVESWLDCIEFFMNWG